MPHPQLQATSKALPEMTARRFFDEICPQVLNARKAALEALGGRYVFLVKGQGAWLLAFPAAACSVLEPGTKVDADLAITSDSASFTALMKGTLDVENAIKDGAVGVAGDPAFFFNLSAAFRPSMTPTNGVA